MMANGKLMCAGSMLSQLAEKDFVAKKQEYYSSRCGQQGSQGPHEQAAEVSQ